MNERLKKIRIHYSLNMRDFASKLGMSSGAISMLENGQRSISQRFIKAVCMAFPEISEEWLLTGEGDMLKPLSRIQEIAQITADLYNEENPYRRELMRIVSEMSEEEIALIVNKAREFVNRIDKDKPS